jgi:hypothetical protein
MDLSTVMALDYIGAALAIIGAIGAFINKPAGSRRYLASAGVLGAALIGISLLLRGLRRLRSVALLPP